MGLTDFIPTLSGRSYPAPLVKPSGFERMAIARSAFVGISQVRPPH